jgi:hypothetical protein
MLIKYKFYSLIVLPYLADTTPSLTKLLAAKETAGSRPAWWLEFGRITQWEGAVLRMSAGFSQISDAIKAGRLRESLSFLGGIRRKIEC